MATHDYIISNASGAAVRADLNNALAAIVSNNSNASSPSTTYAYQWWADTTTGQLKLRNSANSAWITIFELDGTMLMEDGTVSAPGLAFASDLNTGFFRSAADKINFATGGVERLEIGSSEVVFNDGSNDVDFRVESNGNANMLFVDGGNDRIGIGTAAPGSNLDIEEAGASTNAELALNYTGSGSGRTAAIKLQRGGSNFGFICGATFALTSGNNDDLAIAPTSGKNLLFGIGNSEKARLDTSGRLLVGLTSARATKASASIPSFQIEGTGDSDSRMNIGRNSNADNGPEIHLYKTRGTSLGSNTVVQDDDFLGTIAFFGADGNDLFSRGADITAAVDGTPGSDDMPTRLTFATCADGAASATERLRITSTGRVGINTTSPSNFLHVKSTTTANNYAIIENTTTGNAGINLKNSDGSWTLVANDALRFIDEDSSTERLRVDSSGRLGIGTSSVSYTTHINSTGATSLGVTTSSSSSEPQILLEDTAANDYFALQKDGRELTFKPQGAEAVRIDGAGRLLVGTSPATHSISTAEFAGTNSSYIFSLTNATASDGDAQRYSYLAFTGTQSGGEKSILASVNGAHDGTADNTKGILVFRTNSGSEGGTIPTERMRITSDGHLLIGQTNGSFGTVGTIFGAGGQSFHTVSGNTVLFLNRHTNDGEIVRIVQGDVTEGNITVSGNTVSYNGGHLARWSQLASGAARTEILRGSVLSNLDEMCEWGEENNEQLNRMKVSDVEGDKNVSGVFQCWDDDDDTYVNDFYCAMTGDFVIRIAQGTTVARGDLLMSAGDGTAKPQDDDIVRSKTIAKVTSTTVSETYSDNSYCVPCVLMAC